MPKQRLSTIADIPPADGRDDTYFVRGWVKQRVADNLTLAGAIERRHNSDGSDETRVMQQLSGSGG